jgi:hypothetical protein
MERRAKKYLNCYCGSYEMWCWRETAKISWTDRVRNEEMLQRVKGRGTSYRQEREGRLTGLVTSCIGTAFRNGLLKGRKRGKKIEVTGRRRRKRKKLLVELKEKRGYCKLQEEALYRTVWRTGFGRGCGPVEDTAERMNELMWIWSDGSVCVCLSVAHAAIFVRK